eukprot:gene12557-biopygen297
MNSCQERVFPESKLPIPREAGSALLKKKEKGRSGKRDRQLRFQLDPGREHPPRDMISSETGHCYGGINEY